MKNFILSNNILKRFAGLYLIGLIIFLAAWTLSFYFFPEGLMKDTNLASKLAGSDIAPNAGVELARIFMVNLVMATLIVAFNLAFRINRIPLGYLIPPIWFLLYGLILGSNSFTFAMVDRMGPSLAVLQRSGLYELAAYTLITVSTYNFSRFEIKSLFITEPEKVKERIIIKGQHYYGFLVAIIILILSNIKEALMLVNLK